MAPKLPQALSGGKFPHSGSEVPGPAYDEFSIGRDGNGKNPVRVPLEGLEELSRPYIPHVHALVPAARDEGLPVRSERYREDCFCLFW